MFSLASSGSTSEWKHRAARAVSSLERDQICSSSSRGCRPLTEVTATPAAMRRFSPATRTMKNSSRLLAKIARKRARSSSGSVRSSASSSTRRLNSSQLASRSR